MPQTQDWFDKLPDEGQDIFDSLPDENRGQFGLGTATSIGPQKPPKLFSKRGIQEYPAAIVGGVKKLAENIVTEVPKAAWQIGKGLVETIAENPLDTGFGIIKKISNKYVEPMVRGYAGEWGEMIKDPGTYIINKPDQFVGNILDVLVAGSWGVTKLSRLNTARKLLAGKDLSGGAVKAVLKSATSEVKNAEVAKVIESIPDEIRVRFPDEGAGTVYGEGGNIIGQQPMPYGKPTIAPAEARMTRVSPVPPGAELDRPAIFDMLPDEKQARPVTPKITVKPTVSEQPKPAPESFSGILYHGSPSGELSVIDPFAGKLNIEGVGFFLTDTYDKALGYARGATAGREVRANAPMTGAVNKVQVNLKNILDMDAPAGPVWDKIAKYQGIDPVVGAKKLTNKQAYKELALTLNEERGLANYDVSEIVGVGLTRSGYDATTHVEGLRSGTPHRVMVTLENADAKIVGADKLSEPIFPKITVKSPSGGVPPVKKGFVRLYRGEGTDVLTKRGGEGRYFTADKKLAEEYSRLGPLPGDKYGNYAQPGDVFYVDVPISEFRGYVEGSRITNTPAKHLYVTEEVAKSAKLFPEKITVKPITPTPKVVLSKPDIAAPAKAREPVKPLSISTSQMRMGLEEANVELFDNPVSVARATPRKSKVLKPPDEIPAEAIISESRAEALRKATPEQPLKMVYTAGGDLRQVLGDLSAPAVKAFEGAKLAFHSPDVIFYRHPAGKAIYDSLNASDLAKSMFLVREGKKLDVAMGGVIKENGLLSSATFKAADTGFTVPEIINMGDEALKYGFTKDELIEVARYAEPAETFRAFAKDNLERLFRQFGKSRISKEMENKIWNLAAANKKNPIDSKLIENLTETEREIFDLYGRRIKDYIPHVFDKQEMVEFLGTKLAKAQSRLAKLKDTRMAGIYKKQVEELTISLEKAQRGSGNILYDDLPNSIKFKFFEPRTGATGYQVDAVKAYRTYLTGIAKKIFDEPTVRMAVEKYTQLPRDMQAYTKWYLRDYLGYNRGPFDDLTNGIKSMMWMKALGFNPRSAVVNWTQKINTVVDSSPIDSAKGYAMGFTKEGRELFDKSGLVLEVPQQLWEGTALAHQQGLDDVRRVAGFMFAAVEKGNKKHAFLTGYYESLRKGLDEATAMAKGIAKADKTQFRYGRVNMPRALRGPVGVAFQFWSYPIKQLEFLGKLWKENPAKFFAWVAVSEGANKSTQEFLGTDLSSALGLGVNWGQLVTLVDNIANGADAKQILYQLRKIPTGGGIFPYGLGPGIQAGTEATKLVTDLLAGADIDVGDIMKPITPIFIARSAQTYAAIKQGPGEEGKYTVKSTVTGRPTYRESKTDLAKRMLLGKPMSETSAQLETKLRAFEQKSYNDLVSEISDLYAAGKTKESFELMAKYKIRPTKESIKAAFERRAMTATERANKKKPSKARLLYEEHLEKGKK